VTISSHSGLGIQGDGSQGFQWLIDISLFSIMMPLMRTTIDINDAILRELREVSARERRPFRVVVQETLQRGLADRGVAAKTVRIEPRAVGVKSAFRSLSMNQLYDELESR